MGCVCGGLTSPFPWCDVAQSLWGGPSSAKKSGDRSERRDGLTLPASVHLPPDRGPVTHLGSCPRKRVLRRHRGHGTTVPPSSQPLPRPDNPPGAQPALTPLRTAPLPPPHGAGLSPHSLSQVSGPVQPGHSGGVGRWASLERVNLLVPQTPSGLSSMGTPLCWGVDV